MDPSEAAVRGERPRRRAGAVLIVAGSALAVVAGVAVVLFILHRRPPPESLQPQPPSRPASTATTIGELTRTFSISDLSLGEQSRWQFQDTLVTVPGYVWQVSRGAEGAAKPESDGLGQGPQVLVVERKPKQPDSVTFMLGADGRFWLGLLCLVAGPDGEPAAVPPVSKGDYVSVTGRSTGAAKTEGGFELSVIVLRDCRFEPAQPPPESESATESSPDGRG